MYIQKSALIATLDSYYCICVTLTCKSIIQIWNMKIQKQMRFHLPIEVVKGLESFALVFFMHR